MNDSFKITVLIENTARREELDSEHGLSFLIENAGVTGLFDTGMTGALVQNALAMGVDLTALSWIALSHGHFDHTGGLESVLELGVKPKLYTHPEIFRAKYIGRQEGTFRSVGMPLTRSEFKDWGVELLCSTSPTEVADGITLTGEIPRVTDFEPAEKGFFIQKDNEKVQDMLPDDQSLVLRTGRGIVVILGCAHAGVVNTLKRVTEITGEDRIYAVAGGMHLLLSSEERIQKTIEACRTFGVSKVGLAHCTGQGAVEAFSDAFGEDCFICSGGTVMEF